MSNPFKLQQNQISRRVVSNYGLGGGVPIWAQITQKMLTPPPYFRGWGFFWFGLTPPIFLRGVATGLRSGGSPSTVLRGEYNDQGGGQFSNSGGVLWQKSWKKSTPPFQYFRGKVLMVWTVLPLDCSEGGGDISWFLPHNSLWTAELFPSDHCSPPQHWTPADFNPLSIPDCV